MDNYALNILSLFTVTYYGHAYPFLAGTIKLCLHLCSGGTESGYIHVHDYLVQRGTEVVYMYTVSVPPVHKSACSYTASVPPNLHVHRFSFLLSTSLYVYRMCF